MEMLHYLHFSLGWTLFRANENLTASLFEHAVAHDGSIWREMSSGLWIVITYIVKVEANLANTDNFRLYIDSDALKSDKIRSSQLSVHGNESDMEHYKRDLLGI